MAVKYVLVSWKLFPWRAANMNPFHQSIQDKPKDGCPTIQPGELMTWSGFLSMGQKLFTANPKLLHHQNVLPQHG